MSLLTRNHGHGAQGSPAQQLMCPLCGEMGQAANGDAVVAFSVRGEDRGHTAWKCYACGSGFATRGANTEPIPADRWAIIEARYERERRRAEATGQPKRATA